jgi:hypothetical protein
VGRAHGFITTIIVWVAWTAAAAALPDVDRPLYTLPGSDETMTVDAVLDEPAWDRALVIDLAWEVEPGENVPAPVRTTARLIAGPRALFVAFVAEDPDPSRIRARYSDRDRMYADDWVHVVLDTFDDERRAFDFFVNPLGVQGDAVETTAGSFSRDWDTIWDSAGRITGEGYIVEIAIPFSSLRFQATDGPQTWGLDVVRYYPRLVRHKLSATPRVRGNNCYLCQISRVTGFEGATPGRNLEVTPTLTGIASERRDPFPDGGWQEDESDVELGVTARWGVTPNLALSGTLNPDFSQVEADAAQLEVNTRFSLFFSEKRPFFLEGADYFQTPLRAVYTRTMADPAWGAKATGKVGDGVIGAFAVRDEVTGLLFPGSESTVSTLLDSPATTSVARYRHDVGGSSTVGGLITDRRGEGGYRNTVYGADLDYRFSSEDLLKVQILGSSTRYPGDVAEDFDQAKETFTGTAAEVFYMHQNRTWEVYGRARGISPGFRADAGFIPQAGFRFYDTGVLRTWQQNDPAHWYSMIKMWVGYERTEDWDGGMLRSAPGAFVEYLGPFQTSALAIVYWGRQSYRGVEYDDRTFEFRGETRPLRDLEFGWRIAGGDAVDFAGERPGQRLRLVPSVEFFGGRRLNLQLSWIHETFDLEDEVSRGDRLYTADLAELRSVFQFNRRAFVRLIVQYGDTVFEEVAGGDGGTERDLASQLLFSYKLNPWTAVYVGYSDLSLGDETVDLTRARRTAFIKIGYAFVP